MLNLGRPEGLSAEAEAAELATLTRLNALHGQSASSEATAPQLLDARTTAYELAFGMQRQVPELMDLSGETQATLERYGVDRDDLPPTLSADVAPPSGVFSRFARQCLLARRLVEKGVRFVNVFAGTWDHHENVDMHMPYFASLVDQPIAALLGDLASYQPHLRARQPCSTLDAGHPRVTSDPGNSGLGNARAALDLSREAAPLLEAGAPPPHGRGFRA